LFLSIQIIVSCCIALLVAAASCEDVKKDTDKVQEESQNIEKRGLHGSFGGHEWSSGGSSYDDHGHGHHEHVKTITIEKKVPVPYEVIKKVPYTVEKKVSRVMMPIFANRIARKAQRQLSVSFVIGEFN
jgi:hypothetical protein